MIGLLYKASKAGVRVRLIVRGACCLMPEVKGLSDNIRAISIVDKYLEHARLILFYNGGKEKAFILSADWMTRNLSRRVEVGIPIQDKTILNTLKIHFHPVERQGKSPEPEFRGHKSAGVTFLTG